uniref:Uncharacterized protein n=1 Tax=Arundo donax TaxID=35708 RepID=A0A0A9ABM5_ARUDO
MSSGHYIPYWVLCLYLLPVFFIDSFLLSLFVLLGYLIGFLCFEFSVLLFV